MAHDATLEARLAAALGVGGYTEALDVVERSNYGSEAEYIQALVTYELEHSDPRRVALTQKYTKILQQQREAEAAREKEARNAEIRAATELDDMEKSKVAEAATMQVLQAVRDGKIAVADYSASYQAVYKELEEEAINRKAGATIFNNELHRMYNATQDFDDATAQQMSQDIISSLTGDSQH